MLYLKAIVDMRSIPSVSEISTDPLTIRLRISEVSLLKGTYRGLCHDFKPRGTINGMKDTLSY